ncbi:TauD/TfdA family dioxygenase [Thioalkalivibrio sp. HK1]|uniref:TauD/TfdA family dioxygenase n=1 Tax=Thioalkalivibrio sp. HK1 TaxID=1469245 RepID=UPI00046ED62D|nr:TauD/TfdA family dioxygenase [Thioalkalivibrio sp. HK1]
MHYKSLVQQTLHYFGRPHQSILRKPLRIPAAWLGDDMRAHDDWRVELGGDDIDEIERALAVAKGTGKPLHALGKEDFPLPSLTGKIARWRQEIASGRGFQVIRGIPVERWSLVDCERFFWCFGLCFGIPGAQNPRGDLLGNVRDEGASSGAKKVRFYQTSDKIAYHCDAADVVGLLCVQKALAGGISRIVSSVSVYNRLLEMKPDLIDRLYRPFFLDTYGEGGLDYFPVPPCRFADGELRTFYHSDYFRSAVRHEGVPPFTDEERDLLDTYEEIANSPQMCLDMEFLPGDIQLLSNHTQLHARTDYEDGVEPENKRHLLRLWISLAGRAGFEYRRRTAWSRLSLVRSLLAQRVIQRWRRALRR